MKDRRTLEIIAGRVSATGTIVEGSGFSVSKTTGVYNIMFPPNFRVLSATVTPTAYSSVLPMQTVLIPGTSPNSFQMANYINSGGGAGDISFAFIAVGYSV